MGRLPFPSLPPQSLIFARSAKKNWDLNPEIFFEASGTPGDVGLPGLALLLNLLYSGKPGEKKLALYTPSNEYDTGGSVKPRARKHSPGGNLPLAGQPRHMCMRVAVCLQSIVFLFVLVPVKGKYGIYSRMPCEL